MPLYNYEAVRKEGETYKGSFEAPSKTELYAHVRDEGGRLISAKEKSGKLDLNHLSIPFLNGVKTHDKIIFARNLGSMINAGLSVTRALAVMEKQTKNQTLKNLYNGLTADVTKGEPLSASLAKRPKVFSPLFVSMVKAGEESGNLAGSLKIVADQMDKSYQLTKKVHGALIYPSIILSVMVIIAILMLIYMVPTLTATFKDVGATLPLSTRVIIAASGFMIAHTIIVVGALIALVFGFTTLLKSQVGQRMLDVVVLHLPAINTLVKEINSARTARTLSSLLSSGVDIVVALEVTRDVLQNHLYKEVVEHIRLVIQKGETMSSVFEANEKLYPPFVGEMTAVGEETGKIAEMLLSVADYYEEDVDEKTKDLSTIIEPVLMVIIGAGVGVFAVSMLAPTYSLVNNI
jgi:type IV pilus assembly protein PilC